jgi:hypothetical protein
MGVAEQAGFLRPGSQAANSVLNVSPATVSMIFTAPETHSKLIMASRIENFHDAQLLDRRAYRAT